MANFQRNFAQQIILIDIPELSWHMQIRANLSRSKQTKSFFSELARRKYFIKLFPIWQSLMLLLQVLQERVVRESSSQHATKLLDIDIENLSSC